MKPTITSRDIYSLWIPLLLTWLMMSVEGPYIAAIIARLSEAKFNLAAFGISFSIALIVEAPIIMIMSLVVALGDIRANFNKIKQFTHILNIAITLIMLLILTPSIFSFLANELLSIPPEIKKLTHISTLIMLPWAPAIGYRRLYQGVLIRAKKTKRVTYGTFFRLGFMSISAFLLYLIDIPGAYTGSAALSLGVTAEAIATFFMAKPYINKIPAHNPGSSLLSYKEIIHFYTPLALTSVIALGVRPAIVFFLGNSREALNSLAVYPVINGLLFVFSAAGLSFQEVAIALMGKKLENYNMIRNFAFTLSLICISIYALVTCTPLSTVWFGYISGLSAELTVFTTLPAILFMLMPALSVILSFQRGLMVSLKETKAVSRASMVEVAGIIILLVITISILDLVGVVAAALSVTGGRIAANLYLEYKSRRSKSLQNALDATLH